MWWNEALICLNTLNGSVRVNLLEAGRAITRIRSYEIDEATRR